MKTFRAALLAGCAIALASCGGSDQKAAAGKGTAADADKFVAELNSDIKSKSPYWQAAAWLQQTYITDDSQLINSRASEEYLNWQARRVEESKRFNGVEGMSADTTRAIMLLKNVSAPAPSDTALQGELAKILTKMDANYGTAKWCRGDNDCLVLDDIEKIIDDPNQTPEARATAWKGWQETARPI
ncbi:MAG: M2 family metallopeptidase, partial [Micropepsaceae bacterium]